MHYKAWCYPPVAAAELADAAASNSAAARTKFAATVADGNATEHDAATPLTLVECSHMHDLPAPLAPQDLVTAAAAPARFWGIGNGFNKHGAGSPAVTAATSTGTAAACRRGYGRVFSQLR